MLDQMTNHEVAEWLDGLVGPSIDQLEMFAGGAADGISRQDVRALCLAINVLCELLVAERNAKSQ